MRSTGDEETEVSETSASLARDDRSASTAQLSIDLPSIPAIDRSASARAVLHAAIIRSVRIFFEGLPGARHGEDPEDLHRARVAVRRLRSDLRSFAPLVDRSWSQPLREELRWTGTVLGAVRDFDVASLVLTDLREQYRSIDPHGSSCVLEQFDAERSTARRHLVEALDSDRFAEFARRLADAARDPQTVAGAEDPAIDQLHVLMQRPWKRLARVVGDLGPDPTDTALHSVRIRAKRCRYAAEALRPVVGRPAKRFARKMAAVQECLGDLNDSVVIGARLRHVAEVRPEAAFAAGQLSGILTHRAAHCRSDFPCVWHEAADPTLRAWWRR